MTGWNCGVGRKRGQFSNFTITGIWRHGFYFARNSKLPENAPLGRLYALLATSAISHHYLWAAAPLLAPNLSGAPRGFRPIGFPTMCPLFRRRDLYLPSYRGRGYRTVARPRRGESETDQARDFEFFRTPLSTGAPPDRPHPSRYQAMGERNCADRNRAALNGAAPSPP